MSARPLCKTLLLASAAFMTASGAGAAPPAKPSQASSQHQVVTGPVAEYWISTATSTGMTASGLAGGGKPSLSSMMNMMKGGVTHTMRLQLGSTLAASGDPAADHLPPQALASSRLPLWYKAPVTQAGAPVTQTQDRPQQSEPPKGKILIFWGCGEHAPKNQPVVIDLSKLTDARGRMDMVAKLTPAPVALDAVSPPSPQRFKSYGEWPNEKSRTGLDGNASLIGAHVVKGNYSPEIDFSLLPAQDFLAPIQVTNNSRDAAGAVPLAWQAVPGAKGFLATAMGGGEKDADGNAIIVMWTSSAVQTQMMGIGPDYLTSHDLERLGAQKVLLPGDATGCTVPVEVAGAAKGLLYGLTAYGGETNIAYPPRPEDPKTPWNIQWETKIRYRSTTGGILGQNMGGMAGASGQTSGDGSSPQDQGKKKKGFGLGDVMKASLGSMIPGH